MDQPDGNPIKGLLIALVLSLPIWALIIWMVKR
jgi:hypothetical protein